MTIAPSVTFWDAGEFIACSYILGIPHPPGSALYVLIGRLFTLLPIGGQIAFRTNLASALFASLTTVLGFLIVLILARRLRLGDLASYVAGLTAAFFLAFSNTFWSNATESEVYALSMFLMLLLLYLTLTWIDNRASAKGDRLLVLISYLGFLSIAVHMTTFLVMPVIFLIIILHDRDKLKDFRVWITVLLLSLIMLVPTVPTELFLIGMPVWTLLCLFSFTQSGFAIKWFLPFAITLSAMLGYSSQLYIPIRSASDPAIDENDPDTWPAFKNFLERKQYIQQGMLERSMIRRGALINQLGTHERIGWFRFFKEQYALSHLWILPTILGIFGLFQLFRHRPREGLCLLVFLLITTLGLVWYMNFGDGTVPNERLEVRDRDYFFLPGYVLFALFIGAGIGAVLSYVSRWLKQVVPRVAKVYAYALGLIFLILPGLALSANFARNDRSGNWVAYDFAYNLLNSCDKDALFFTNGDNDTFPVWFLQEVERIRPDVRNINFSLLNARWYIRQLKEKRNVPITLTAAQINSLQHYAKENRINRVQDQMLEHILDANVWRYPVNFAVTVSADNRLYQGRSLDNHLMLDGLIQRLVPQEGVQMVDVEGTRLKINQVFRYRGIGDSAIYLDESTQRMLANYFTCFFNLADTLGKKGEFEEAQQLVWHAKDFGPDDWRVYAMLVQLYTKAGQKDKVEEVIANAPAGVEKERLYYNSAFTNKLLGKEPEYEAGMWKILQNNPGYQAAYEELFATYYNQKRKEELVNLLDFWTKNNPGDKRAMSLLRGISSPSFDFPDTAAMRRAIQH